MEHWGDTIGDSFPDIHTHVFHNPGRFAYTLSTHRKSYGEVIVRENV
jgi:hypothetical protein